MVYDPATALPTTAIRAETDPIMVEVEANTFAALVTPMGADGSRYPAGQLMVMKCELERAVAIVNVTVNALPLANALRSAAAAMKD